MMGSYKGYYVQHWRTPSHTGEHPPTLGHTAHTGSHPPTLGHTLPYVCTKQIFWVTTNPFLKPWNFQWSITKVSLHLFDILSWCIHPSIRQIVSHSGSGLVRRHVSKLQENVSIFWWSLLPIFHRRPRTLLKLPLPISCMTMCQIYRGWFLVSQCVSCACMPHNHRILLLVLYIACLSSCLPLFPPPSFGLFSFASFPA